MRMLNGKLSCGRILNSFFREITAVLEFSNSDDIR